MQKNVKKPGTLCKNLIRMSKNCKKLTYKNDKMFKKQVKRDLKNGKKR